MANGQKVKFEPNVPTVVTLRFTGGKPVQSPYSGDQMLYTCQEGSMYVSPHVGQLIDASGAGAGDTIAITLRQRRIGQQKHEDWNVEKLSNVPPPPDPFPPLDERTPDSYDREKRAHDTAKAQAIAQARGQATPAAVAAAQARVAQPAAAAAIEAPASAPHPNVLAQALVLAIDAAVIAEAHARQAGLSLAWRAEDIRAMAATLLIDRRQAR